MTAKCRRFWSMKHRCVPGRLLPALWPVLHGAVPLLLFLHTGATPAQYAPSERERTIEASRGTAGSPYVPVDSWIDAAALRLHDLGYLPSLYAGLRPYTRISLAHALRLSQTEIERDAIDYGQDEAVEIYRSLSRELAPELDGTSDHVARIESAYARVRGVAGPVLADSFNIGQTYVNDYGRPTNEGINGIAGASGYVTRGRFNLYVRGEYQHAPGGGGYNPQVVDTLNVIDGLTRGVPHFVIPAAPLPQRDQFRLINAIATVHLAGHQVGFGRRDTWLGPATGASMAWSTNAEPIYAFHIDRIEPLYIPLLHRITGPFRYEFFVGSLKGHDTPNAPWVHVEKANFKPTPNIEFGFERTAIWGGKDHVPVTFATFFRSFFSPAGVEPAVKVSRDDPGARFSTFDFSWRIPYRDHLFSLYADSFVHDNVFPVSNPRRAAVRTGLLIARLPFAPRVDVRAEGAYTDVNDPNSLGGGFLMQEVIYRDAYSNRGNLLGDNLGRENKGGNLWITFHKSPREQIQFEYRRVKAAKDFIPNGTTQQDFRASLRLRPKDQLEIKADITGEISKVPLLAPGARGVFGATVQLTWFPQR